MRRLFVLVSLLALSAAAQEKLVESIEVHVINVDVVVTDRAGNPVHGLKREDFEVFENGKPQKITNYYEVKPDESGAIESATETAAPQQPATPPPLGPAPLPEDL